MARIFLTGASGFVGGEVARILVNRGHAVTALLRRDVPVFDNDGGEVAIARAVRGDIVKPRFGLDPARFRELAETHDLMLHCAASTRFDLSDEEYASINTGGTAHAIDFAREGGMPLLQVSTAYVCGTRDGPILETDPLPESGFANGYEASKAQAERLLAQSGLHHAIARPSIVVGDSRTGQVRSFGPAYGLFKILAKGRLKQVPVRIGATLDFVPIDHVATGIADIADRIEEAGGVYHLVSGRPLPMTDAIRILTEHPGIDAPAIVAPEAFDAARLSALQRWTFETGIARYGTYLTRDPRFDDARFRQFGGRGAPPTDEAYFRRLIGHAIAAGFLRTD